VRQLRRLLPIAAPDKKIIKAGKGRAGLPLRGLCQLDGRSWLKLGLAPLAWGMIVSE